MNLPSKTNLSPGQYVSPRSLKRIIIFALSVIVAACLFGVLVYGVLAMFRVSQSADTVLHGPTVKRLWATVSALLALFATVLSVVGMFRQSRAGSTTRIRVLPFAGGAIAAINGALVLLSANGGPGSGNGVVGGAAALVLGLCAMILGMLNLRRSQPAGSVSNR